jgi:hypothetical protein
MILLNYDIQKLKEIVLLFKEMRKFWQWREIMQTDRNLILTNESTFPVPSFPAYRDSREHLWFEQVPPEMQGRPALSGILGHQGQQKCPSFVVYM